MLEKGPAFSIVKTDGLTENRLVERLSETGNLGTSRGKLHPNPVSNQVNGDYGNIEPGAAIVG